MWWPAPDGTVDIIAMTIIPAISKIQSIYWWNILKINNKLLFPLCRSCADLQQQTPCSHSEEERSLIGTWVTDEIKKALEEAVEKDNEAPELNARVKKLLARKNVKDRLYEQVIGSKYHGL